MGEKIVLDPKPFGEECCQFDTSRTIVGIGLPGDRYTLSGLQCCSELEDAVLDFLIMTFRKMMDRAHHRKE